jgi:hypothetical protein
MKTMQLSAVLANRSFGGVLPPEARDETAWTFSTDENTAVFARTYSAHELQSFPTADHHDLLRGPPIWALAAGVDFGDAQGVGSRFWIKIHDNERTDKGSGGPGSRFTGYAASMNFMAQTYRPRAVLVNIVWDAESHTLAYAMLWTRGRGRDPPQLTFQHKGHELDARFGDREALVFTDGGGEGAALDRFMEAARGVDEDVRAAVWLFT